ncbi:hypothetical protein [Alkalihalobacillus sp. AL-G]|uniref:hypothetical protein n=1 Tax=Alkalihalobacillus sp. AL-G TaxID=2926399 RepID=UPI00272A015D|nr:hypothetical protein [Alkalihalobacillus sp. AL-G]WLD94557.1 hypothetical protein MOJ78_06650 [Alkalihalobacillus sp. AL-G]
MKGLVSILGGILIGILVSYFTLEYNGWTISYMGKDNESGEPIQVINELDVNLLMNGLLIVIGMTLLIYVAWTLIEKKIKQT